MNEIIAKIKNMDKIELTLNKEDLSVTGDLDKLIFDEDDESRVITKNGEFLTLTKKDNEVSCKVTSYRKKYNDKDDIEDVKIIKDKLFHKGSGTSKNITVFTDKVSELYNAVTKAAFSGIIEL